MPNLFNGEKCSVKCHGGFLAKMSFVRSFVLCGQEPSLLWTPARMLSIGPVRMPMERGMELVGVCGVCATCGRGRLSRHVPGK